MTALLAIILIVAFWLGALAILVAWLYRRGLAAERREDAARAQRLAELQRARPTRAPQGAVKPAKPTYPPMDLSQTYGGFDDADRELEVPPDAVTRLP